MESINYSQIALVAIRPDKCSIRTKLTRRRCEFGLKFMGSESTGLVGSKQEIQGVSSPSTVCKLFARTTTAGRKGGCELKECVLVGGVLPLKFVPCHQAAWWQSWSGWPSYQHSMVGLPKACSLKVHQKTSIWYVTVSFCFNKSKIYPPCPWNKQSPVLLPL